MILVPSVRNTSSKLEVNFESLSRTRNLAAREHSERIAHTLEGASQTPMSESAAGGNQAIESLSS
jgi:hypothetical protein